MHGRPDHQCWERIPTSYQLAVLSATTQAMSIYIEVAQCFSNQHDPEAGDDLGGASTACRTTFWTASE
jgi:hypothetical protein